jgi:succinate dehydrogenase/fumarate reductase flavoprotein subunit
MHTNYDLIIVGAGAAGLMAATEAAEKDKKILLIEKMD